MPYSYISIFSILKIAIVQSSIFAIKAEIEWVWSGTQPSASDSPLDPMLTSTLLRTPMVMRTGLQRRIFANLRASYWQSSQLMTLMRTILSPGDNFRITNRDCYFPKNDLKIMQGSSVAMCYNSLILWASRFWQSNISITFDEPLPVNSRELTMKRIHYPKGG